MAYSLARLIFDPVTPPRLGPVGFARDAGYLVRPDGHIGLCLPGQEAGALAAYLDERGRTFSR